MKSLLLLAGAPIALWAVLLYPGWLLWGDAALLHSALALALCLVPALVTFAITQRLTARPEARLMVTLGASGVRMGVALGAGLALYKSFPETFPAVFLYWLVVFYLLVLGIEVYLLVRHRPDGSASLTTHR